MRVCFPRIVFSILRPGHEHVSHSTGPSLTQIMACRLFGAKPLSIYNFGTNLCENPTEIQYISFHKMRLTMPSAFGSTLIMYNIMVHFSGKEVGIWVTNVYFDGIEFRKKALLNLKVPILLSKNAAVSPAGQLTQLSKVPVWSLVMIQETILMPCLMGTCRELIRSTSSVILIIYGTFHCFKMPCTNKHFHTSYGVVWNVPVHWLSFNIS